MGGEGFGNGGEMRFCVGFCSGVALFGVLAWDFGVSWVGLEIENWGTFESTGV